MLFKGFFKAHNNRRRPIKTVKTAPAAKEALAKVQTSLDDDKAEDIIVIDLKGKTSIGDYMVIASGTSQRQVGAMADHLQTTLKAAGFKSVAMEGADQCDWVLIDSGDIIVHLFRPEVREFYNLEKIWDRPIQEMKAGDVLSMGDDDTAASA